jgi:uncharacterized protein (DUF2147 family)
MRTLKQSAILALAVAVTLMSSAAWPQSASPIGLWKSIDDVSGKPRALIRITESKGTLQGKIEKLFSPSSENPKCEKCEGALKNAPVIGLVILSGLKRDGAEYGGGQIIDPESGKVYSSKIRLSDDGKKLDVRGFMGVSLLGRSQTWERQ